MNDELQKFYCNLKTIVNFIKLFQVKVYDFVCASRIKLNSSMLQMQVEFP